MKDISRETIRNIFIDINGLKRKGIWLSGISGDGEFKSWYDNGQLYISTSYKNDKLDGEFKSWYNNGQLYVSTFYKNGKLDGEFKKWHSSGYLFEHAIYQDGKLVKKI